MGSHKANQTSFKKGQRATNWNGFKKGHKTWNKGLKGVQAGEKAARWKGGLPNCDKCGKQLSQRHPKFKLCMKCFGESEIGKQQSISHLPEPMKEENNPNWKGGTQTKDRLERIKFQKTIQKQVFIRDNFKCQICDSEGDLQVDHIKPWSKYIELRFCIKNCRTLCAKCHYQITFGRLMPSNVKGWGHNLFKEVG